MNKKIFMTLSAAALLVACSNEDYTDWVQPEAPAATTAVEVPFTASAAAETIDLATVEGDSVKLINVTLPANAVVTSYKATVSAGDNSYDVYTGSTGNASVEDLQNAVISLYNREATPREVTLNVTANAKVKGEQSEAVICLKSSAPISLKLKAIPATFNEFIYVAGNHQGWSPSTGAALRSPECNGVYTGFTYLDGGFKFTKIRDWQGDWGYWDFANPAQFTEDGGNLVCNDPGYYYLVVNLETGTIEATKVTFGLVGPATPGEWDAAQYTVMEYDASENGWVIETELKAGEFKFTTNGSWDINLGGSYDDLQINGDNLNIAEEGTYLIILRPGRETSDKMYCEITKQ